MKTIYFVRHAKSSWDHPGLSDEERPLIRKGYDKTEKVIAYLKSKEIKVDRMISSPAVRAMETARFIAAGLGYPEEEVISDRRIYEGYYETVLTLIYSLPDTLSSVMIFGHNPTISQLVNLFIHPGIEAMPTSAVAALEFDTATWSGIPSATSRLDFYICPKML